ncbi:MAG TPA: endo-1,4-beta-xylanase [Chloroflexota bacterium]|nr:endo-1,4-beta-xylanase [Chloroflexota bacterium]
MGVLKFRLPPNEANRLEPDYRKAYITGLDRTPGRLAVELRNGVMTCTRESTESGRLFVPWPIEGFGMPLIGTATLAERPAPYTLAVELARGKLNDIRNQLSDWLQLGLRSTPQLEKTLGAAQKAFVVAATTADRAVECVQAAQASLDAATAAGDLLIDAYTSQILQSRLSSTSRLPTHLGCVFEEPAQRAPVVLDWPGTFNMMQVSVPWAQIAASEGQYRWDILDSQLSWARRAGMAVEVGPVVEFRYGALPDWLSLWEGDSETIGGMVADFVQQVVQRYRGRVPLWHLVHRPASSDILGLTEEEQIRITARAIQVARQADPGAQLAIGIDRPWADWMGASHFQLGPLHLCDYLLRADLGLSAVTIEVAPGFSPPGSHMRDLFEFSKLLDLYSLLNVPLCVWMALPSALGPDPLADPSVTVEAHQWPRSLDENLQAAWGAKWLALAVAKPFVRSVSWLQSSDATPHLYPHAGLLRADQTAKPLLSWMKLLRKETLA